ncbi:hypothetical protein J437_LFUL019537 [Ladona fulva]|uniref:RNA-directed DNA polymerase n=1 Tax=Ladona fulva TaxID=123851 RepID=A0A8K0KUG7_LADFU|nr:hypothetical protein J437_LFUL019537 [Ladona fulva]
MPGKLRELVDSGASGSVVSLQLAQTQGLSPLEDQEKVLRRVDGRLVETHGRSGLEVCTGDSMVTLRVVHVLESPLFPLIFGARLVGSPEGVVVELRGCGVENLDRRGEGSCDEGAIESAFRELFAIDVGGQTKERTTSLVVLKKVEIPSGSLAFVSSSVPDDSPPVVATDTVICADPGREWVSPGSVLDVQDGRVFVPVMNLGHDTLVLHETQHQRRAPETEMMGSPFGEHRSALRCNVHESPVETSPGWNVGTSLIEDQRLSLVEYLCLATMLNAISGGGLKLRASKCYFAMSSLSFLGHVVDSEGIREGPSQLSRQGQNWSWGAPQERIFEGLKPRLSTAPVLQHFQDDLPCEIHTDAPYNGLGATERVAGGHRVVYQPEAHGAWYHSNELECLAIVLAMEKFRHYISSSLYIYGRPFTVVTENYAVTWLHQKQSSNAKLGRWIMALQEHDVKIVHRKGKANVMVDALSSNLLFRNEMIEVPAELFASVVIGRGPKVTDIILQQRSDKTLMSVLEALGSGRNPQLEREAENEKFQLTNGVLYRKNCSRGRRLLLVVPRSLQRDILETCLAGVTEGHLGVAKTRARVQGRYWRPQLAKHVCRFVQACPHCQLHKQPPGKVVGLQKLLLRLPLLLWGLISWAHFPGAVPDTEALNVKSFSLEQVVLRHGTPQKIISDRGTGFTAQFLEKTIAMMGVKHAMTAAYHPQANGLCDRENRTFTEVLSSYVAGRQTLWDKFVQLTAFALNTSKQESTSFSPSELVHGRSPVLPEKELISLA